MTKDYEGMFLIKLGARPVDGANEGSVSGTEKVMDEIRNALLKNEARITTDEVWDKRRKLTYPVKKEKEALYYRVEFSADSSAIDKIKRQLRINENILRFVIFNREK